jgi:hypothetical protein
MHLSPATTSMQMPMSPCCSYQQLTRVLYNLAHSIIVGYSAACTNIPRPPFAAAPGSTRYWYEQGLTSEIQANMQHHGSASTDYSAAYNMWINRHSPPKHHQPPPPPNTHHTQARLSSPCHTHQKLTRVSCRLAVSIMAGYSAALLGSRLCRGL